MSATATAEPPVLEQPTVPALDVNDGKSLDELTHQEPPKVDFPDDEEIKEEEVPEVVEEEVEEKEQTIEETIEILEPSAEPKAWTIGLTEYGTERTYIQKPLSYIRRMKFFALVSKTIKQALSESEAGTLSELLSGNPLSRAQGLSQNDLFEAESFIQLISSLVEHVPEFLEDAHCIILNIPPIEREWAKAQMEENEEDGGLSDEAGIEIIQIFIAQNWDAIQDFFGQMRSVVAQVQRKIEANDSESNQS